MVAADDLAASDATTAVIGINQALAGQQHDIAR
ncbi:hypothetical protein HLBENOHH_02830 [Aeromonas dhakensis]